jgi:heme a synthase
MTRAPKNSWLHCYAVLTALATFSLVWVGGLVTSHGAGMAVPDWPTTYGYNMFFFPFSKWVGGIFYEHSHRLVASAVGLLTVILTTWLWMTEQRRWLRWLGGIALVAVILQGSLGGLRVTQMKDVIGVFHATFAQLFLGLVCAIALFTSRWWIEAGANQIPNDVARVLRSAFGFVTGLLLLQLILGASMRHQHAGLAIPDFPTAYGKLWPAMDAESVIRYNQARGEVVATNPITAVQIGSQMVHRVFAFLILLSTAWAAGIVHRRLGWPHRLTKLAMGLLGLILLQATLGAATIWTNKAADVATAHVAVGALSLVTGILLTLMVVRQGRAGQVDQRKNLSSRSTTLNLQPRPANVKA